MASPRVAFVTCNQFPNLTAEDQPILECLRSRGIQASAIVWNDASVDWNSFDVCVIRSPYDYVEEAQRFLSFLQVLEECSCVVQPPVAVLRWNFHKRYLIQLAAAGVPVVPSVLLPAGSSINIVEKTLNDRGWEWGVLKPAVGSFGQKVEVVQSQRIPAKLSRHMQNMLVHGDFLIQPFVSAVRTQGEYSLIFISGQVSHAVHKVPPRGEFRVQGGRMERANATPRMLATARSALANVPSAAAHALLVARIDLLPVPAPAVDEWWVTEVEVLDPMLFFNVCPEARVRFCDALEVEIRRVVPLPPALG
eukprot:gnl/Spiro4/6116_TR3143_c0_g1_i1.p1 gnl/Spiro4/6116_TR3143_c0_g1~~gnl/Spiro4/6116_TR3143_c0_g1_i1.p1  ORF type:complete len:342 (-),score=51.27 gnl/Spiro4/6116_TR3143_c0_g1_i1:69-989(-)